MFREFRESRERRGKFAKLGQRLVVLTAMLGMVPDLAEARKSFSPETLEAARMVQANNPKSILDEFQGFVEQHRGLEIPGEVEGVPEWQSIPEEVKTDLI